ncbi:efflux RND transporter periplasmic adaptor subunit [Psychromonas ossibalaenae]|uniref:efflux RND transporter periplasmic adaptor subunit n=1 Tax=Psychromonas ossibalaenae TaxID=444922 RepID=UPI0003747513|nr:efflux RND transporter periplasmic adaptor subunit [Psychromonas ossibalaenae]
MQFIILIVPIIGTAHFLRILIMIKNRKTLTSAALAITALVLLGCGDKQDNPDQELLRPVRTALATEAPQGLELRFAGTIDSASTTALSFRVGGTIHHFPVTVGAKLKHGDLIAQLDTADLNLNLERSKAELAESHTILAANQSRFNRFSDLHARQALSAMDYDLVKAEYEASLAQVSQAEKAVDLSLRQVSYAKLAAPADGCYLSSTNASVNENISAGHRIATLNCGNTMEITSIVSGAVANLITLGQKVEAIIKTTKETRVNATITEIGLSSTTSGLYFVTAQLDQSQANIRPSMAAELLLNKSFNDIESSVWVPMVSINEDQGAHYVMTFESEDGINGIVHKTPVEVGKFSQGFFQVNSGLEVGQHVITAGLSHIYDGLKVKLLVEDNK